MAIITNVIKKPRVKNVFMVTIDTGEVFEIYDEFIIINNLKINTNIDYKKLENLSNKSLKKIGEQYCLQLLSRGLKTKKELRDKLLSKNISLSISNEILDKLEEYGYINDKSYAEIFISYFRNKMGVIAIRQKLVNKGIDKEILNDLFAEIEDDKEIAFNIAEKYMKNKDFTFKNKSKLYSHLMSKGFKYEAINSVLNQYEWNIEN